LYVETGGVKAYGLTPKRLLYVLDIALDIENFSSRQSSWTPS